MLFLSHINSIDENDKGRGQGKILLQMFLKILRYVTPYMPDEFGFIIVDF
jgi:hypothetical protein